MNNPTRSNSTKWFLAIASIAWVGGSYAIALVVLGVSPLAALGIAVGTATLIDGAIAYFAWEYKHAMQLPSHQFNGPQQDVDGLVLSQSACDPCRPLHRRTKSRLCEQHPFTDRVTSLHRPLSIDRRMKIGGRQGQLKVGPLLEVPKRRAGVAPWAN